ncbi:MAG: DUF1223 domain-containing protein [Acidobacteriota bacterium]|nr:DUF1223 domain-containing protein [Acidobacteriota bacterium]
MKRTNIVCALAFALPMFGAAVTDGAKVPVLLELFTSEGCSSCPSADRLLDQFDREQPVPGAQLIVLSEHVDYWNHLGWSDPFSSPAFSQRQREYASKLGANVYTPQLVIDGIHEFVGSDRAQALRAIQKSIGDSKPPIGLSAKRDGDEAQIHIDSAPAGNGIVYLVLAQDRAHSQVARGENSGKSLDHVAVAYSFKKIGTRQKDIKVHLKPGPTRVIVFMQDPSNSRVLAVAQALLPAV